MIRLLFSVSAPVPVPQVALIFFVISFIAPHASVCDTSVHVASRSTEDLLLSLNQI